MTDTNRQRAETGEPTNGARLLREWFRANTATKTSIAADIGMSKQSLSHLLRDSHRPSLEQSVALEQICGVPPIEWLLTPVHTD